MSHLKNIVLEYIYAISGKPKTEEVLNKYITDPDLKEHIRFFERAFPEYELIVDDLIEEGNKIFVRGKVKGIHRGNLMGIPPTGKKVINPLMIIYELQNNKIKNHLLVADNFALMQQLGVIK